MVTQKCTEMLWLFPYDPLGGKTWGQSLWKVAEVVHGSFYWLARLQSPVGLIHFLCPTALFIFSFLPPGLQNAMWLVILTSPEISGCDRPWDNCSFGYSFFPAKMWFCFPVALANYHFHCQKVLFNKYLLLSCQCGKETKTLWHSRNAHCRKCFIIFIFFLLWFSFYFWCLRQCLEYKCFH